MMESFVTYECHGDIKLNVDHIPELKDKTNQEIQDWLNEHYYDLYVDTYTQELRKDKKVIYSEEEEGYYEENPEERPADEDDEGVIELSEYWSNTSVEWDKIKCEEKNLIVQ